MRAILEIVQKELNPLGYTRTKTSFHKTEREFYKLIHFQKGAHGGGYFFVNVCFHPIGLPQLLIRRLSIPKTPLEYECIVRQRIEEVVGGILDEKFKGELVGWNDPKVAAELVCKLPNEIQNWFAKWASHDALLKASERDLENLVTTVVPKLKRKAIQMLWFFCALKSNDKLNARRWLQEYLKTEVAGLEFPEVDSYLKSLASQSELDEPTITRTTS